MITSRHVLPRAPRVLVAPRRRRRRYYATNLSAYSDCRSLSLAELDRWEHGFQQKNIRAVNEHPCSFHDVTARHLGALSRSYLSADAQILPAVKYPGQVRTSSRFRARTVR